MKMPIAKQVIPEITHETQPTQRDGKTPMSRATNLSDLRRIQEFEKRFNSVRVLTKPERLSQFIVNENTCRSTKQYALHVMK